MQEHDSRRGTLSDRLAQYAWGIGTIFWVIALAIASPPAVRLHAAPTVIAAYHFNEAGGATLTDVSGRNNHGALANGPVWTAAGKYGGARQHGIGINRNRYGRRRRRWRHRLGAVHDRWREPRQR